MKYKYLLIAIHTIDTLPIGETLWLLMMLSCNSQCVEENQQDYPPGEQLGLYIHPAFSSAEMVPSASTFTGQRFMGKMGKKTEQKYR